MAEETKAVKKPAKKKVEKKADPIGPFEGSTVQFNPETGAGMTLPAHCTLEWVEFKSYRAKITKIDK